MSPFEIFAVVAILFVAMTMQSSIGFGSNLISMPTIAIFAPELVPGSVLFASALVSILTLLRERQSVDVGPVKVAIVGRIAGTGIGVWALGVLSETGIGYVIGLSVLAMVLIVASGAHIARSSRNMLIAGTASGFSASTAGIGGPPVALMYQASEGPEIRSSMAAYFLFGSVITFLGLNFAGLFGWEELLWGLAFAPAAMLGFVASRWTVPIVDRGHTRSIVLVVSASAALILLGNLALA